MSALAGIDIALWDLKGWFLSLVVLMIKLTDVAKREDWEFRYTNY